MKPWHEWEQKLNNSSQEDVDDVVDELCDLLMSTEPQPAATGVVRTAVASAQSALSIRTSAICLAFVASDDDLDAITQLEQLFETHKDDHFLGPAMLQVLGLYGLRSDTARTGAITCATRVRSSAPRGLLIVSAKVSRLLCDKEHAAPLRQHLSKLSTHVDNAVRAEAKSQLGRLLITDAMLAHSSGELMKLLNAARTMLQESEDLEELRPDSKILRLMTDALLLFDVIHRSRSAVAESIAEVATELRAVGSQFLRTECSPAAQQISTYCAAMATEIEATATEIAASADWTNFDAALGILAECHRKLQVLPLANAGNDRLLQSLSNSAEKVLQPRLGPLLARSVGRRRIAKVIAKHTEKHGEDEIASVLQQFLRIANSAEEQQGYNPSEQSIESLNALAKSMGYTNDELIDQLQVKVQGTESTLDISGLLKPVTQSSIRRNMTPPTIGIIVALVEEYTAVRLMLQGEASYQAAGTGGGREYLLGNIPSSREGVVKVVLAQTSDMGNNFGALRAAKLLHEFPETAGIIMCGIAGGAPNPQVPDEHVRLGDIVVSNRNGVVQYDFGKDKKDSFEIRAAPRPPSALLMQAVQVVEQNRALGQRPWDDYITQAMKRLGIAEPDPATDYVLNANGNRIKHPDYFGARPRIFSGAIASANCVQGDFEKRDALRDNHKVRAVEMEASGVADATWENGAGYLVVRGICDYCDIRTKQNQTDDWKQYAAIVAAAYVRAIIEAM